MRTNEIDLIINSVDKCKDLKALQAVIKIQAGLLKNRDRSIKKLNQDCNNLVHINNNQAIIVKLADEEIKNLKDAVNIDRHTLKIIYDSIIAKDYIAANELLSEVIDTGMGYNTTGVNGGA